MTDRILAFTAILVLLGFVGILVWSVPRIDLGAVVGLTVALALWDLLVSRRESRASARPRSRDR